MNTLRRLVGRWLARARQAPANAAGQTGASYLMQAADELAAKIPKWERLEKAANDFCDAYDAGTDFGEAEARKHYRELRAALEEVS